MLEGDWKIVYRLHQMLFLLNFMLIILKQQWKGFHQIGYLPSPKKIVSALVLMRMHSPLIHFKNYSLMQILKKSIGNSYINLCENLFWKCVFDPCE